MWIYVVTVCFFAPMCLKEGQVSYRSPETYSTIGECFTAGDAAGKAFESLGRYVIETYCGPASE